MGSFGFPGPRTHSRQDASVKTIGLDVPCLQFSLEGEAAVSSSSSYNTNMGISLNSYSTGSYIWVPIIIRGPI